MQTELQQNNGYVQPQTLMAQLANTPISQIPEMEMVRNKYISNYNICNNCNDGEIMYHRNLIFIKQAIAGFGAVKVDPFSVYACITTMAVDGLSAAPDDAEVYLYPKDGKMKLQKQAGSHVKRLIQSGQVLSIKKVNLVYDGDIYEVEDGRVAKHTERFQSERIIAGYVIYILPDGSERHFTYRPSQWESWRASSPQANGANWRYKPLDAPKDYVAYQPKPGFLETKLISHSATSKSWIPGRRPATVEIYSDVFTHEDEVIPGEFQAQQIPVGNLPPITESEEVGRDTPAPVHPTDEVPQF